MAAPAALGAAVFQVTANVLPFVQAMARVNLAAHTTVTTVQRLLGSGFLRAGGALEAAGHNVEQVFGRSTAAILAAADRQAAAFGQSRAEYLAYAADVGRALRQLGAHEDVAASQAARFLDAAQRLAQSRRVGLGEAMGMVSHRGTVFAENEVKGMAVQMGLLTARNQMLDEGAELLARNELAIRKINATTEQVAGASFNWNSQVLALQGNLSNLTSDIGALLSYAFTPLVAALSKVVELLDFSASGYRMLADEIGRLLGLGSNLGAISVRNDQAAAEAQRRRQIGAMFGGGGGGGGAGFQGGLVEFARHAQQAAFQPRQISIMERHLKAAQDQVRLLQLIALRGQGAPAMLAGGGAAMAAVWHD